MTLINVIFFQEPSISSLYKLGFLPKTHLWVPGKSYFLAWVSLKHHVLASLSYGPNIESLILYYFVFSSMKITSIMPEARDRLSRAEHPIATYRPRLRSITLGENAGRGDTVFFVLEDEPELARGSVTPFRWRDTMMTGIHGTIGVAAASAGATRRGRGGHRRGIPGSPGIRQDQNVGQENISPTVGRGRGGRGSVLPYWYPRTPLRDITSVVRVMVNSCFLNLTSFGLGDRLIIWYFHFLCAHGCLALRFCFCGCSFVHALVVIFSQILDGIMLDCSLTIVLSLYSIISFMFFMMGYNYNPSFVQA